MADWKTYEHTLAYPIKMGEGRTKEFPNGFRITPGMVIDKITLREPDAEALELIEESGAMLEGRMTIRQINTSIRALSGLPEEITKKIHHKDLTAMAEHLGPLMGGSEEEGDIAAPKSEPKSR